MPFVSALVAITAKHSGLMRLLSGISKLLGVGLATAPRAEP